MIRTTAMAAAFVALAATLPAPQAKAQETLGGAIGGAILGGAIGGATGAVIGAQAERRHSYYWWRGRCYYRYPSGEFVPIAPGYCY